MVRSLFRTIYNLILVIFLSWGILFTFSNYTTAADSVYEQHNHHSSDGIGKYYMGREIAQVMGYTGAGWLERPSREVDVYNCVEDCIYLQPSQSLFLTKL